MAQCPPLRTLVYTVHFEFFNLHNSERPNTLLFVILKLMVSSISG